MVTLSHFEGGRNKFHTLNHPMGGRSGPRVTAFEMHELEEYKRSIQERSSEPSTEELLKQFSGFEKEVSTGFCCTCIKMITCFRCFFLVQRSSYVRCLPLLMMTANFNVFQCLDDS